MPNMTRVAQIFKANGMFSDTWSQEDLTRATTAAYFGLTDPEDRVFVQQVGLELDRNRNARVLDDLKNALLTHEAVKDEDGPVTLDDADFERQQVPLIDIPLQ